MGYWLLVIGYWFPNKDREEEMFFRSRLQDIYDFLTLSSSLELVDALKRTK